MMDSEELRKKYKLSKEKALESIYMAQGMLELCNQYKRLSKKQTEYCLAVLKNMRKTL